MDVREQSFFISLSTWERLTCPVRVIELLWGLKESFANHTNYALSVCRLAGGSCGFPKKERCCWVSSCPQSNLEGLCLWVDRIKGRPWKNLGKIFLYLCHIFRKLSLCDFRKGTLDILRDTPLSYDFWYSIPEPGIKIDFWNKHELRPISTPA